jgi:hypothetical protein
MPLTLLRIAAHKAEPPAVKVALTSLRRDVLCESCSWPDVCAGDRTCWLEEPASFMGSGALQARLLRG